MYRYVIEHPQWIPLEWQKKLDLRAGHDKGRIYRIYPENKKPRPIPRLDKLSTKELVAALDSPSGWQRDMVQMMLVRKKDEAAVGPLEFMHELSKRAATRLQAICTLSGLEFLERRYLEDSLRGSLRDRHAGVRRHAARITGHGRCLDIFLEAAFLDLEKDSDPSVRMQCAYSIGEMDSPDGKSLGKLALKDHGDPYILAAIMSSVTR